MRIRAHRDGDAPAVGRLIASTYRAYNLSHAAPDEQERLLGPFKHAFSDEPQYQEAICAILRSPTPYVAEENGQIIGVLRGREKVLANLFVSSEHQGRGNGRRLVERFEHDSQEQGIHWIRVASTLSAIGFYQPLGYRKTTGIRHGHSFEGTDFQCQPMKKNFVSF